MYAFNGAYLGGYFIRPFLAKLFAILVSLFILPAIAGAQQSKNDADMQGMPGMDSGQMQGMQMGRDNDLITIHPKHLQECASGTSGTTAEPDSNAHSHAHDEKRGVDADVPRECLSHR